MRWLFSHLSPLIFLLSVYHSVVIWKPQIFEAQVSPNSRAFSAPRFITCDFAHPISPHLLHSQSASVPSQLLLQTHPKYPPNLFPKPSSLANIPRYRLITSSENFNGFDKHLMENVRLIDASPSGTVDFEFLIDERYTNVNGVMHGGAVRNLFPCPALSAPWLSFLRANMTLIRSRLA